MSGLLHPHVQRPAAARVILRTTATGRPMRKSIIVIIGAALFMLAACTPSGPPATGNSDGEGGSKAYPAPSRYGNLFSIHL